MPNFNKCTFIGHLTRDAEVKFIASGTAITEFGIAVNDPFKKDDKPMFLDCSWFGSRGEKVSQYILKGQPILVEGRLKQDRWNDKATGAEKFKFKIDVTDVVLLGGKKAAAGGSGQEQDDFFKEPA